MTEPYAPCYSCSFDGKPNGLTAYTWFSATPLPDVHPCVIELCDRCAEFSRKAGIALTVVDR